MFLRKILQILLDINNLIRRANTLTHIITSLIPILYYNLNIFIRYNIKGLRLLRILLYI